MIPRPHLSFQNCLSPNLLSLNWRSWSPSWSRPMSPDPDPDRCLMLPSPPQLQLWLHQTPARRMIQTSSGVSPYLTFCGNCNYSESEQVFCQLKFILLIPFNFRAPPNQQFS